MQGALFILVNYYGPNTQPEQVKILKEIDNHMKKLISSDDEEAKIIFGGDFNMYFDCYLDGLGGSPMLIIDVLVFLRCCGFVNQYQQVSLPIYMVAEDLPPKHN